MLSIPPYRILAVIAALAMFAACSPNTDEATKGPSTERHGTMREQLDSMQAEQGPGIQPRDTVTNTGP